MLRVAVLDDQKEYLEQIEKITKKSLLEMGILYELKTYTEEKQLFMDLEDKEFYDIFLLDMKLQKLTGLQAARRIQDYIAEPVIIYITNFVEYAPEAFEVNAYRYIPKVMLETQLPKAYASLYPKLERRKEEVYVIEKNHELEYIPLQNIFYIKKEGKYTAIVYSAGEGKVRRPLEIVLEELNSRKTFFFLQIDRGCAVNVRHVIALKDQQIYLRDRTALSISRPRLNQVKEELKRYWRG